MIGLVGPKSSEVALCLIWQETGPEWPGGRWCADKLIDIAQSISSERLASEHKSRVNDRSRRGPWMRTQGNQDDETKAELTQA